MARNTKRFSPSQLSDFVRCARCYWLARVEGVKTPQGIKSRLPNGMDERTKEFFDGLRAKDEFPKALRDRIPGKLFADQYRLNSWRNWQTGLICPVPILGPDGKKVDEVILSGAVDELIQNDAIFHVLDYKTRGTEPGKGYSAKYYQIQANSYAAMLKANKMPPGKDAFFVYWWPHTLETTERFKFGVTVDTIEANPEAAIALVRKAHACLTGPLPGIGSGCELCDYTQTRRLTMKRIHEEAKKAKEAKEAVGAK